jgi:hypothetical protein
VPPVALVRAIDDRRSPGQAPASDARFVTPDMAILDATDPLVLVSRVCYLSD